MQLLTERLFLIPLQPDGMRALLARTTDPELVGPYTEMLTLSLRHPEQWIWYTAWGLYQNDSGDFVGDLCFKGLPKNGQPEIGYGLLPEFQGQGYATEAVRTACRWPSPAWPPWRLRPNPPMRPPRRFSARSASSPPGRWARRGRGSFCAPCPPERSFFGIPLYISLNLCHNLRY